MKSSIRGLTWLGWGAVALAALSLVWVAGCSKSASAGVSTASGAAIAASAEKGGAPSVGKTGASPAERTIERAGKESKYTFLLFYRLNEPADKKMKDTFARAGARLKAKAAFIPVDASSRVEKGLIAKYRVDQAPKPLTLVIAPNGAIVQAFTKPVEEKALADAFVSPKVAEVSKALQGRKLVALCLQGAGTKHNAESRQAAQQFVGDSRLGGQALLVTADPSKEPDLLKRCGIRSLPTESTIVMLLPPGQLVASVTGSTTKDDLLAKLQAGMAACGSGCGPSGCGP